MWGLVVKILGIFVYILYFFVWSVAVKVIVEVFELFLFNVVIFWWGVWLMFWKFVIIIIFFSCRCFFICLVWIFKIWVWECWVFVIIFIWVLVREIVGIFNFCKVIFIRVIVICFFVDSSIFIFWW